MKEKALIRLYEANDQRAAHHAGRYEPSDDVTGWAYEEGDQIGLCEQDGGYLMGILDRIDPKIHHDDTGSYRLATVWTQD